MKSILLHTSSQPLKTLLALLARCLLAISVLACPVHADFTYLFDDFEGMDTTTIDDPAKNEGLTNWDDATNQYLPRSLAATWTPENARSDQAGSDGSGADAGTGVRVRSSTGSMVLEAPLPLDSMSATSLTISFDLKEHTVSPGDRTGFWLGLYYSASGDFSDAVEIDTYFGNNVHAAIDTWVSKTYKLEDGVSWNGGAVINFTDTAQIQIGRLEKGTGVNSDFHVFDNIRIELAGDSPVVTNTDDSGSGSLRGAISFATPGSTITFDPAVFTKPITIFLTSGQLLIDKSLTIDASSLPRGLTIDAGGKSRIMQITPGNTVALHSLALTGGRDSGQGGGGIWNDHSTLTITNTRIYDNDAWNKGGGIYNDGQSSGQAMLTLNNSSLYGNSADLGAGIYNEGKDSGNVTLILNSTTLYDNLAIRNGGGIHNAAQNSGKATLILNNSTLSRNSAKALGGGILINGSDGTATLSLNNATLSNNSATSGGGIYELAPNGTATLTLHNSIIAANSADTGTDLFKDSGTITPSGVNLIGDNDTVSTEFPVGAPNTGNGGNGDLVGTSAAPLDPLLALLANYGGLTPTMPPLPGSPAIDMAAADPLMTSDQRGAPRPIDGDSDTTILPDIGAVEFQPVIVTTNADAGAGSLRDAILEPFVSTITFDPTVFNSSASNTITLDGSQLLLDRSLTIDASGLPSGLTIDADGKSRIMRITSGNTVTLSHLTLTNGRASGGNVAGSGGAIYNDSTDLTLNNSTISKSHADASGGGIMNGGDLDSATLTLNNSTISSCHSDVYGGGIFNYGVSAQATLNNSTISNCHSGEFGGGIVNYGISGSETLNLNNSTISSCHSDLYGGGIANFVFSGTATLTLHNSIIAANSAISGADIFKDSGTITPSGVNLIGDNDSVSTEFPEPNTPGTPNTNDDLVGTSAVPLDPRLSPLGNYGGPVQTMHPLAGSRVINPVGSGSRSLETDARGFSASLGSSVDIGAVEAGPVTLVNNVGDDAATATTLRKALANAAANPIPGRRILFNRTIFNGEPNDTILLTSGQLNASGTTPEGLFIDASNITGGVTIDAGGASRILEITPGNTVALHSLILTGGMASGTSSPSDDGGGIYNDDSVLTITNTTLNNNSAVGDGGGIFNGGLNSGNAMLFLNTTTFDGNTAKFGGGIYNAGQSSGKATLTLSNTTLSGNSATRNGGGIHNNGGNGTVILNIKHSTLSGNTASNNGGGVFHQGSSGNASLALHNTIIAGNTSSVGQDVFNANGSVTPTGKNLFSDLNGSSLSSGENVLGAAPLLAPLGYYDGFTQTMPPLPGSPAIDGTLLLPTTLPTDQRGSSRPSGPLPDIGAVEAFPFSALTLASNDGDSIPDIFEGSGGPYPHLDPSVDDSALDTDGDGSSDAEEIANMTNLFDSSDRFRVISLKPVADFDPVNPVMTITIATFPGLSYQIESDPDLKNFIPLDDPFVADDFQMSFDVLMQPGRDFIRVSRK